MTEDTLDHTKVKDRARGPYVPGNTGLKEALERVRKSIEGVEVEFRSPGRGEVNITPDLKDLVLKDLKELGFDHFVALTCIDQPEERRFDLIYHLWSYGARGLIMVKTHIDRETASIPTVVSIFRPAITYEREIHEMFGVDFPGNPRLTQFILEDWDGPPPMRKDFDSIQYSVEKYGIKIRNPKSLPPGHLKKGGA